MKPLPFLAIVTAALALFSGAGGSAQTPAGNDTARKPLAVVLKLDDLVKGGAGVLESILDLGPLPASRGGLFERGCALFRGKGRKSHAYVTSDVELSDTDR